MRAAWQAMTISYETGSALVRQTVRARAGEAQATKKKMAPPRRAAAELPKPAAACLYLRCIPGLGAALRALHQPPSKHTSESSVSTRPSNRERASTPASLPSPGALAARGGGDDGASAVAALAAGVSEIVTRTSTPEMRRAAPSTPMSAAAARECRDDDQAVGCSMPRLRPLS